MSNPSDSPDLNRLRELLRGREAQTAAGRTIPEDVRGTDRARAGCRRAGAGGL